MFRKLGIALAAFMAMTLGGCGYNDLQRQDEGIKASWSEVVNQYQRRADLVPNLVNTVKGYAQQEQTVLTEVTNASEHRSAPAGNSCNRRYESARRNAEPNGPGRI